MSTHKPKVEKHNRQKNMVNQHVNTKGYYIHTTLLKMALVVVVHVVVVGIVIVVAADVPFEHRQ
jgi:hypothetical protein